GTASKPSYALREYLPQAAATRHEGGYFMFLLTLAIQHRVLRDLARRRPRRLWRVLIVSATTAWFRAKVCLRFARATAASAVQKKHPGATPTAKRSVSALRVRPGSRRPLARCSGLRHVQPTTIARSGAQ